MITSVKLSERLWLLRQSFCSLSEHIQSKMWPIYLQYNRNTVLVKLDFFFLQDKIYIFYYGWNARRATWLKYLQDVYECPYDTFMKLKYKKKLLEKNDNMSNCDDELYHIRGIPYGAREIYNMIINTYIPNNYIF